MGALQCLQWLLRSIYGEKFEDEWTNGYITFLAHALLTLRAAASSFARLPRHDRAGLLSMANAGKDHGRFSVESFKDNF